MKKIIFYLLFIGTSFKLLAQTDTVKCYVQIMYSFENTIGMSRNIEDNYLHKHGGMMFYTKAYGIRDDKGKFIKFLSVRKRELTEIWKPNDQPQVMIYNW